MKNQDLPLVAYFDDSGTHDDHGGRPGSEVAVFAGYVASSGDWFTFREAWEAILTRESLPYYHTVDCAHGTGHFKSWSPAARNRIHRECVETIASHNLMPIGSAVATQSFKADYDQRVPESRRVRDAGYFQAVWNTLRALGLFVAGAEARVRVVIEESPKNTAIVQSLFDAAVVKPSWEHIASCFEGPPHHRPKTGHPQLQAADVLAYEMGVKLRRQFGWQEAKRRRSWETLSKHALSQSSSAGLKSTLLRFKEA